MWNVRGREGSRCRETEWSVGNGGRQDGDGGGAEVIVPFGSGDPRGKKRGLLGRGYPDEALDIMSNDESSQVGRNMDALLSDATFLLFTEVGGCSTLCHSCRRCILTFHSPAV